MASDPPSSTPLRADVAPWIGNRQQIIFGSADEQPVRGEFAVSLLFIRWCVEILLHGHAVHRAGDEARQIEVSV